MRKSGDSHAVAALERNRQLMAGRVGLIGLPVPELPAGSDAGAVAPLVLTEHAGMAKILEQGGRCQVRFGYEVPAGDTGTVDTLVIFAPKARETLSMQLNLAGMLLAEGGRLLLVGEKREGIAGAARRLQALASDAYKADSARHCQVWVAHLPAQQKEAFEPRHWVRWHEVEVDHTAVPVAGMPGIFSDGRLDQGTAHLLRTLAEAPVTGPVLDFACGAGVVGAWLQARFPDLGPVDGVDVQAQAVLCARLTYDRNQAAGRIIASDGLPADLGRYRTIVTNPPFHSGVRTDTSMTEGFLSQARQHLLPGGELRLVANRFLPYQDLLEAHVGPSRALFEDSRFVVYQARVPA